MAFESPPLLEGKGDQGFCGVNHDTRLKSGYAGAAGGRARGGSTWVWL